MTDQKERIAQHSLNRSEEGTFRPLSQRILSYSPIPHGFHAPNQPPRVVLLSVRVHLLSRLIAVSRTPLAPKRNLMAPQNRQLTFIKFQTLKIHLLKNGDLQVKFRTTSGSLLHGNIPCERPHLSNQGSNERNVLCQKDVIDIVGGTRSILKGRQGTNHLRKT